MSIGADAATGAGADADRLPPATAWAITVAAVVGTLGLIGYEPLVAVGLLPGLGLALARSGFDGSYARVTLASAFLPVAVLGTIAVAALAGGPVSGLLTIAGTVVGATAPGVVTGRSTTTAFVRAGAAALCAAVVGAGAASIAVSIESLGGVRPVIATILWLTGEGPTGLLIAIGAAGAAAVGSLFVVPPAAFARPSGRGSYVRTRNAVAWSIAIATAVVVAGLGAVVVLSGFVPPLQPLVAALGDSTVGRGLATGAVGVGLAVALYGAVVRASWLHSTEPGNAVVPIVVGGVAGIAVPFAAMVGVGVAPIDAAALFGVTAVVLGVGWLGAWGYADAVSMGHAPSRATALAIALAVGGVGAAASVEVAALDLETARAGAATFVALAAGTFTYDVGQYGLALTREVGAEGASRRPQLVRLGWSGAVAVVGVPVASLGVLGAAVLAPTLSIPATAGVIAAVTAVLGGAWLLFR